MRAYRKYRYKKYRKTERIDRLPSIGIAVLILIILATNLMHKAQVNPKSREAKLQYNFVQAGYAQDAEKIQSKDKAALLSKLLIKELGKPYAYGKEGPDEFDCSGLVKYIYSKLDIDLPRVASEQACFGEEVDESSLRFGDIISFSSDGKKITHIGIYLGNGYFVHAPKTGDVVKVSSLYTEYYKSRFKQAVRILS